MLTKRQLIEALNFGMFDEVLKECRRYGDIISDRSFDIETGYYAGANRIFTIKYKNLYWRFEMLNGEIRRVAYTKKHNE